MYVGIPPPSQIVGESLQMNRGSSDSIAPNFFGSERQDWRKPSTQSIQCLLHDKLRSTTARRIRRVAIHPVLSDVDVKAAQIYYAELIKRVINLVKLEVAVGRLTSHRDLCETIKDPTID